MGYLLEKGMGERREREREGGGRDFLRNKKVKLIIAGGGGVFKRGELWE